MPHWRLATSEDLDSWGLSKPEECGICKKGGHSCGGCGLTLQHTQGDTCVECWKLVHWDTGDDAP